MAVLGQAPLLEKKTRKSILMWIPTKYRFRVFLPGFPLIRGSCTPRPARRSGDQGCPRRGRPAGSSRSWTPAYLTENKNCYISGVLFFLISGISLVGYVQLRVDVVEVPPEGLALKALAEGNALVDSEKERKKMFSTPHGRLKKFLKVSNGLLPRDNEWFLSPKSGKYEGTHIFFASPQLKKEEKKSFFSWVGSESKKGEHSPPPPFYLRSKKNDRVYFFSFSNIWENGLPCPALSSFFPSRES